MISKAHGGKAPARVFTALALVWLGAWGCGSDAPPPPSAPPGTAGSTPPPSVGSVRDAGATGDRPATSQGTGMATGRFCNTIILSGGMSIDFTVEIGDPAVRLTAGSRLCAPGDGQPCSKLPTGTVPYTFSLLNPMTGQINVIESGTMVIGAGEELFMLTTLNAMNLPELVAGILNSAQVQCNGLGYADIPRLLGGPDGGAPAPDAAPAAQPAFGTSDDLLGRSGNRIRDRQRVSQPHGLSFDRL
jgi:hypothetical protein